MELTEQLNSKSMEMKWYKYMKYRPRGCRRSRQQPGESLVVRHTMCTKVVLMQLGRLQPCISAQCRQSVTNIAKVHYTNTLLRSIPPIFQYLFKKVITIIANLRLYIRNRLLDYLKKASLKLLTFKKYLKKTKSLTYGLLIRLKI